MYRSRTALRSASLSTSSPPQKTPSTCPSSLSNGTCSFFPSNCHTYSHHPQTQPHRPLQNSLLFLLPPRRSRHAHVRHPTLDCFLLTVDLIRPLRHCALHPPPAGRVLPDPGRFPRLLGVRGA